MTFSQNSVDNILTYEYHSVERMFTLLLHPLAHQAGGGQQNWWRICFAFETTKRLCTIHCPMFMFGFWSTVLRTRRLQKRRNFILICCHHETSVWLTNASSSPTPGRIFSLTRFLSNRLLGSINHRLGVPSIVWKADGVLGT